MRPSTTPAPSIHGRRRRRSSRAIARARAIVADEFAEQRSRRTPLERRAAVQLEYVHAFDDSLARVAVE
jgi:hypothetical protein